MIKITLFLALLVAVTANDDPLDILSTGLGVCSLCTRRDSKVECCLGNTMCTSDPISASCDETEPVRNDYVQTQKELDMQFDKMGSTDYCSVCCGLNTASTRCCTGVTYCSCTRSLEPFCLTY